MKGICFLTSFLEKQSRGNAPRGGTDFFNAILTTTPPPELVTKIINTYWIVTKPNSEISARLQEKSLAVEILLCQLLRSTLSDANSFKNFSSQMRTIVAVFIQFIVGRKFKKSLKESFIRAKQQERRRIPFLSNRNNFLEKWATLIFYFCTDWSF